MKIKGPNGPTSPGINARAIPRERSDVLVPRIIGRGEAPRWTTITMNSPIWQVVGSEALRAQVNRGEEGTWCEFEGGYRARYEPEYKLIRIASGDDVININLSDDGQSVRNISSTTPVTSWPRLATAGILSQDWNSPVSADTTRQARELTSVRSAGPRQADETK